MFGTVVNQFLKRGKIDIGDIKKWDGEADHGTIFVLPLGVVCAFSSLGYPIGLIIPRNTVHVVTTTKSMRKFLTLYSSP